MQGTVKTFDPATRTGIILDDAKNELAYDSGSFETPGPLELRLGQRVRFTLAPGRKVRGLQIITL